MKIILLLFKFMIAAIIFFVTASIFMATAAIFIPRLYGANYYDAGCFDGVTFMMMQYTPFDHEKEIAARLSCSRLVNKLKTKGHI